MPPIPPYSPLLKPNQMLYGTGYPLIVCGWYQKGLLASKLSESDYAAIGQLYSRTDGIDMLIRNLLANPDYQHLVTLSATVADAKSGAVQALNDFFSNGFVPGKSDTGEDVWEIRSIVSGAWIRSDIPEAALEALRKSMTCLYLSDPREVYNALKVPVQRTQREKLTFTPKLTLPTVRPGPRYGHRIEAKTIAEAWVKILHRIKSVGTIRPTGYDGYWQELIDMLVIVTEEPPDGYFPSPNYLSHDRQFLADYIPQILDDAPYQEGVKYTYGQRLRSWFGFDQVEQVIQKLVTEVDAASAVMNLWDPADHTRGGSPCLNHIWVRVVEGEMSLTATFRSNDMFGAWPANAMGLRALQEHIRQEVNSFRQALNEPPLKLGPLVTLSQSAHIYDNCWDYADQVTAKHLDTRKLDLSDQTGYFRVAVEEGVILVTQCSPKDSVVAQWSGKNATLLARKIIRETPTITTEHAAYLGGEIYRAQDALELGLEYSQDSKSLA